MLLQWYGFDFGIDREIVACSKRIVMLRCQVAHSRDLHKVVTTSVLIADSVHRKEMLLKIGPRTKNLALVQVCGFVYTEFVA